MIVHYMEYLEYGTGNGKLGCLFDTISLRRDDGTLLGSLVGS